MTHRELIRIAYAPYETIEHPTPEDWQKTYDALVQLVERSPKNGYYPNTLGYICYYGYHTGQRNYIEARKWFEKGARLNMIESMYKLADMLKDGLGGKKIRIRPMRCITPSTKTAEIGNGIVLDWEAQECTSLDGGQLLNDKVDGDPQYLPPGDSAISWTGTVARLVGTPNWRFL